MYNIYKIKNGDSLESIANNFNTTMEVLIDINDLNNRENLKVGDDIVVPANNKQYFEYYVIRDGDNLYQISKKYNINPTLLASLNGINPEDYIYPGQTLLIPKSNFSYYLTKEGDTLSSTAKTFGTSVDKMIDENETIYLLGGQLLVHRNR